MAHLGWQKDGHELQRHSLNGLQLRPRVQAAEQKEESILVLFDPFNQELNRQAETTLVSD